MDSKLITRSNMRGIRRCPDCGFYNGYRAKSCKNKLCGAFKPKVITNSWIDAVELIRNCDTRIFSVRTKERKVNCRNFVEITDTNLSTKNESTSVANRNAVCYIDTCKYDVRDFEIICKHVKSATTCNRTAEKIYVNRNIIDSLKITQDFKNSLWQMCTDNDIPPLQRINLTTFVVPCSKNVIFPTGRLHITVVPDAIKSFKMETIYQCACEKFKPCKLYNSPNENICVHILFLLIGLLSNNKLKNEFEMLCNTLDKLNESTIYNLQSVILKNFYEDKDNEQYLATDQQNSSKVDRIESCNFGRNIIINFTEKKRVKDTFIKNDKTKTVVLDLKNISEPYGNIALQKCIQTDSIDDGFLLTFDDWLNYVIEKINNSIHLHVIKSNILHQFHVHENVFAMLQNRFAFNNRIRLPHSSILLSLENRKLIRHTWLFSTKAVLKKIFTTATHSIRFQKTSDSNREISYCTKNLGKKFKQIKPKERIVFIQLEKTENSYFTLSWIPDVYQKSKIGILTIEFKLGLKNI